MLGLVRGICWALLALPAPVWACGGLFCAAGGPTPAPVDQTGERILFEVDDDQICATADIQYTGNPEAFAWVVPLPSPPTVSDGDGLLLNFLSQRAGLTWQYPAADNDGCPQPAFGGEDASCACFNDDALASQGSDQGIDQQPPAVDVLERQTTKNYETVTLDALTADDLVEWLDLNGYNVSENMVPAMQPYLDEGMVYLAVKLRTDVGTSSVQPLRFCYTAAAPQIPLRLTAVAAQPRMSIDVFIASYTLFSPVDATVERPDPATMPFNFLGNVGYAAWLARQSVEHNGRFWSLEYAGPVPQGALLAAPTGPDCPANGQCDVDSVCIAADGGQNQCLRFCGAGCEAGEACDGSGYCAPITREVSLPPWLTHYRTRLSPEQMNHDPLFVATPEREAFDGVVDLSGRAPMVQCFQPVVERQPSLCAFVYCGRDAQCVADDSVFGRAGCDCPADQVATVMEVPGGFAPTCRPRENPLGVTAEDGGDPCAGITCRLGECVAVAGFPTCDCEEGAVAYVNGDRVVCNRPTGPVITFAEGATPETGNRDDAMVADPRRRKAVPILVVCLLALVGLRRRRSRAG